MTRLVVRPLTERLAPVTPVPFLNPPPVHWWSVGGFFSTWRQPQQVLGIDFVYMLCSAARRHSSNHSQIKAPVDRQLTAITSRRTQATIEY